MSTPEIISISVSAVAVTAAVVSTVRLFVKPSSGPIAIRRKGSDKTIVLPGHYSEAAVRSVLEAFN